MLVARSAKPLHDTHPKEDTMRRTLLSTTATVVLASVFGSPAAAVTVDTLAFFAIAAPNTCVASDPGNPGTFLRTYQEPTNQCPGLTVFHQVKGWGPTGPWATESFYMSAGYIWQMMEISYFNGTISSYRAFRNETNYWKGIKWVPTSFDSSTGASFSPVPLAIEHWTNDQGQAVCLNTKQWYEQVNNQSSGAATTSLPKWIQDNRQASRDNTTYHDVDALVRWDIWGGGQNLEEYYYGRWINPATGAWEPLGLVAWNWYTWNGSQWVLSNFGYSHHLVDCAASVPCSTCPP
jgi:hypothetical protein